MGTPQSLGTSAPTGGAAGDISYTLSASDFPIITPSLYSTKYCAMLVISGQNLSGATATVNFNVLKNGTSIIANQSQTNVINNNYWTHSHYRFFNVSIGDKLEAQIWSSVTGVNINYYSIIILPSQMELTKSTIVKDLNVTLSTFSFSKGVPVTTGQFLYYPTNSNANNIAINNGTTYVVNSACIATLMNGYGLGRLNISDASLSSGVASSSTIWPNYYRNAYPSIITFREVLR